MAMNAWDRSAASANNTWQPDEGGATNGWKEDHSASNEFTGEFSAQNISKHANGDLDAPSDGGCRICGSDQHFARDCSERKPNSGLCYNCGESGHNKADCTNPRVERAFDGECRVCGESGHRAAECSQAPAQKCKICGEEGHSKADCTANRLISSFAHLGLAEVPLEEAWKMLERADEEKDVDDIKRTILTYARAYPAVTYPELEEAFRDSGMNTHLIAKKQAVSDTHTIVNLQGEIDQKYVVSFQFSAKPRRAKFAEGWPDNAEENLTRLAEAGLPLDRMVPKCDNCGEMGHVAKKCPQEKVEKDTVQKIMCAICNVEGHRARDCAEERKSGKKGCRICSETDHLAKDCPNKEARPMVCRNCDQEGHISRECPLPTDWSRVKCKNCDEMGHGAKRCPQPPKVEAEVAADGGSAGKAGGDDWGSGQAEGAAGSGGWDSGAAAGGSGW